MSNNSPAVITQLHDSLPIIEKLITLNAPNGMSDEQIKAMALEEISHVQTAALYKPEILNCEPLSVLLAVKQAIRKNLTLDPSAGLVYMRTRKVNIGGNQWRTILEISDTANGKISLARQCGRILDVKRPTVKYNGEGQVENVTVEFLVPSHPEPRWERIDFGTTHFTKWRIASHKENSRLWNESSGKEKPDAGLMNYANPNYTNWKGGIDPEFASTKAIKHGLNKLGININEPVTKRIHVEKKDVIVIEPAEAIKAETSEITSNDL
jgi:hypothetical protein